MESIHAINAIISHAVDCYNKSNPPTSSFSLSYPPSPSKLTKTSSLFLQRRRHRRFKRPLPILKQSPRQTFNPISLTSTQCAKIFKMIQLQKPLDCGVNKVNRFGEAFFKIIKQVRMQFD